MDIKNIGIIGHGFVGKAVEHGFTTINTNIYIADPNYNLTVSNIFDKAQLDAVFICVPTPMEEDGSINADIVLDVLKELRVYGNDCVAIIKSTITPDVFEEALDIYSNIVYVPEFMRERHANYDFIHHEMLVIGSDRFDLPVDVHNLFRDHSRCDDCPTYYVDLRTASMIKYTMNSFLAMKVLFFNGIRDIFEGMGIEDEYPQFAQIVGSDSRIGSTHMNVPGPDGRKGFGGACFAKDTSAFADFARNIDSRFQLLEETIRINSIYRSEYSDLDAREKEQNVVYDLHSA